MDGLIAFFVLAAVVGYFYLNRKAAAVSERKVDLIYIETIDSGVSGDFVTTYGVVARGLNETVSGIHFEPTPELLKCGGYKVSCDPAGDIFKISMFFYVNSDAYQYNYQNKVQAFSELSLFGYLTISIPGIDGGEFPIYKNGNKRY